MASSSGCGAGATRSMERGNRCAVGGKRGREARSRSRMGSYAAFGGRPHRLRADVDGFVEIDDIVVPHADAPARTLPADGRRLIGAVDAIDGAAEIHGAGAERIARAASHEARQI